MGELLSKNITLSGTTKKTKKITESTVSILRTRREFFLTMTELKIMTTFTVTTKTESKLLVE